ncbi:Kv channel-interacting protein 1-like isoform X2 [Tetranychus urticae]|uniref:Kv channel-interacting protein 1-like isoform X2 n=1 Tax=Tetranychus urticae TaxID=32264 RepID=UPI00077BC5DE|nr:Kv channel-interacting protein 1-like isoform X2 [Tetranychus urticae]
MPMFGDKKKGPAENLEIEESDLYVRCKPGRLNKLCKVTRFNKQEIRKLYQGFKQECPSGLVTEEAFKGIFAHYFPQGDSSIYAHYVFKTFQSAAKNKGKLNFEDFICMLSSLSRGSTSEKLRWIFNLYDINGDGFITKQELLTIVRAVYRMLGDFTKPLVYSNTVQEHVDKIFFQMDTNHDGVITFEEFSQWCLRDDCTSQNLTMFDTIFM